MKLCGLSRFEGREQAVDPGNGRSFQGTDGRLTPPPRQSDTSSGGSLGVATSA
jgi:hypothetical protein